MPNVWVVRADSGKYINHFLDGGYAGIGWNDLGEFQLPAGKTDIKISNDTTGPIVIADAISWRRVSGDD